MTSKEALEYLTSKTFTGGNSILETEAEICAGIVKQDLERLEALENENQELKETIKIRKEMNINLIDFGTKLKQENEKLTKAIIDILEYVKCELDSIEIVDRIENILNEVLNNEIYK